MVGGANASEEKPKDAYFIFFKNNLLRRKTFPINFRNKKNPLPLYFRSKYVKFEIKAYRFDMVMTDVGDFPFWRKE